MEKGAAELVPMGWSWAGRGREDWAPLSSPRGSSSGDAAAAEFAVRGGADFASPKIEEEL